MQRVWSPSKIIKNDSKIVYTGQQLKTMINNYSKICIADQIKKLEWTYK